MGSFEFILKKEFKSLCLEMLTIILILFYIGLLFAGLFGWEVNSSLFQTLTNFFFFLSLTSIIGWETIWSVIKTPSSFKRKMSDWYIIFLVTILNHSRIPQKFIMFTLVLGSFISRKIVQFWSISYPNSFIITFFSVLTFSVLFYCFIWYFFTSCI